jgi:hypothetical protein
MPYAISPRVYNVKATRCGGGHTVKLRCYPDTELNMTYNFTLYDGETSKSKELDSKKDTVEHKSKDKSHKFDIELRRNATQSFKINVLNFEKEKSSNLEAKEAYNLFKIIRQLREKVKEFEKIRKKVFGDLENCNTSHDRTFTTQVVLLNLEGEIKTKWLEIAGSRFCDWEASGQIKCNPLLSISLSWDFDNLITSVPVIGPYLGLTDLFLEKFDLGDLAVKLEVKGSLGLSSKQFIFRKYDIVDKSQKKGESLLSFSGEIEVTLKAYAKGKFQIDTWIISAGGEAHAEVGSKGKFGDAESIYNTVNEYVQDIWSDKEKKAFEKKYGDKKKRESKWVFENGIQFHPTIGFSGLAIYTILYAEAGFSATTYKAETPGRFGDAGPKAKVEDSKKHGWSTSWGDKKEKYHAVIGAYPILFKPEINFVKF